MKNLVLCLALSFAASAHADRLAECGPIGETDGKIQLKKVGNGEFSGSITLEEGYVIEAASSDAYRASAASFSISLSKGNDLIARATSMSSSNPTDSIGITLDTKDTGYPSITCWLKK